MKIFSLVILVSFIGIAVFSFSGLINHESLFSHCVNAAIPGGMPCSNSAHDFGMNILHAQIFQSFSIAITTFAALAVLFLLAFYLVQAIAELALSRSFVYFENSNIAVSQSQLKLIGWLELNQQHPGSVIY